MSCGRRSWRKNISAEKATDLSDGGETDADLRRLDEIRYNVAAAGMSKRSSSGKAIL
jgi:hypothetical protein